MHYGRRFNAIDGLSLMAEFINCAPATVLSWLTERNHPKGEALIKLQCYLVMAGYVVEENEQLPLITQHFAQLLAFEVKPSEWLKDQMGYAHMSGLYEVVIRGSGLMAERISKMTQIVAEFDDERTEKVAEWQRKIDERLLLREPPPSVHSVESIRPGDTPTIDQRLPELAPAAIAALLSHSIASTALLLDEAGKNESVDQTVLVLQFVKQQVGVERVSEVISMMQQVINT